MRPPTAVRRFLRSWRCPAYEIRNKILGAPAARRNLTFQHQEISRLSDSVGSPLPSARVLVVIPTYKRPEALLRAVNSALSQSFPDLVVVVVDDGAGLPDLPGDPRLFPISLRRNTATLGLVRNVGINLADSEFIAFLDDDNVWTEDHVATAVAELEKDPTLAAVYTSLRRLRPDGTEMDVLGQAFDRKKFREDPTVDANSIMVRRSANPDFSVVPRNRDTLPKEDWEYVWRMSRRGRVVHVPRVTVIYSVNPASYYTPWDSQDLGS